MRISSIIISSLILLSSCAPAVHTMFTDVQSWHNYKSPDKFPVQILSFNSLTVTGNRSDVRVLGLLHERDSVKIEDGYLIGVHYSGNFFEIEGDSIFSVSDIDNYFTNIDHEGLRPYLNHLIAKKATFRAIHTPSPVWIKVPLSGGSSFEVDSLQNDFCFYWKTDLENYESNKYQVKIMDIYEDTFDSMIVNQNWINIDISKYKDLPEHPLLLVSIYDYTMDRKRVVAIQLKDNNSVPYPICDIKSSIHALAAGYSMELDHRLWDEAYKMFKLAAENSDNQAYDTLLSLFESRHRNLK